jgi:hypothetical protein
MKWRAAAQPKHTIATVTSRIIDKLELDELLID